MAALGGIVLASPLISVDTSTGGGTILLYLIAAAVISGTSLFGGRGIRSAVLGSIVVAMIDNGLGLLNVSAGTKFIVTAVVLLAAVTLDSLSRQGRKASGR